MLPLVCIVTLLPSPYQVELFNEVAGAGRIRLRVVYLREKDTEHPWGTTEIHHECCLLQKGRDDWENAWAWCRDADLTVFNYYMHPFAFVAMRARSRASRPWAFWGERPGAMHTSGFARWMRQRMLAPLNNLKAPIWGVGEFAIEGYRREWPGNRAFVNLPYFSDLNRFRDALPARNENSRILLFSGILNRRKNVITLAETFARLAPSFPGLHLWILGSGPLEAEMRRILDPVAGRVRWFGFESWEKLPGIYAAADLLCLPSLYDGWGMVIPEALASGMPVIASRLSGAAVEFIRPGVNGWLIDPENTGQLHDAIMAAARLPAEDLNRMRLAARDSVSSHSLANGAGRLAEAALAALPYSINDRDATRTSGESPDTQGKLSSVHLILAANYTADQLHSMERYTRLVSDAATRAGAECSTFRPARIFGRLAQTGRPAAKYLAYIDKYVVFPVVLRWKLARLRRTGRRVLVHVTDQGNAVSASLLQGHCPVVVTCHDLIAAKPSLGEFTPGAPRLRSSWFQRYNFWHLGRANTVICVSQKTLDDCRRLFPPRTRLLTKICNPLDPVFLNAARAKDRPDVLPEKFLVQIGNDAWYKNRPGLLRIYRCLRDLWHDAPDLVMIGAALTPEESTLLEELKLRDHVQTFIRPENSLVIAAYQHAQALVFPSLEEGFGWPVIEAMACGCPVFASGREPMIEVGGTAAEYIDPEDPEGAARVIATCLQKGEAWQREKSEAGLRRAAEFNMVDFGDGLVRTYLQTLAESGPA